MGNDGVRSMLRAADFLRDYRAAHRDESQRTLHDKINEGELEKLVTRFAPETEQPIDGCPASLTSGQAGASL